MKSEKIVNIDSIEEIGNFDDEYVYDLEMEDSSHTFIANDILVHNTDSIFVSFKPAMDSCNWKDLYFNNEFISNLDKKTAIITGRTDFYIPNKDNLFLFKNLKSLNDVNLYDFELILIDGSFVKNRELNNILSNYDISDKINWNWSCEKDFIQGIDKFKYADYFKERLDLHASKYGVENKEDFELERISESIINIKKKKYIQHIVHEDGIDYDRLSYIFPKGVELVRSSTPAFAREKIIDIVKYLFSHPDSFNIKDLLSLVKNLRSEFELAYIDDICLQSSVSNYDSNVYNDKNLPLKFEKGAHFAVKAAAHYNYLLNKNSEYQNKYEFIKSGTKIKYFACKNKKINDTFAYIRGFYPIEFAPEIDYDTQFEKSILSPINSIIQPLNMPEITKRLSVIMDIFS